MPEIFKELMLVRENSLRTFNLRKCYNSRQSRSRKPVPFICSQSPNGLFGIIVLSPSLFIDLTLQLKLKAKCKISIVYMCLHHVYGTNCEVKIKELLGNF